jgi:hypothetical protein
MAQLGRNSSGGSMRFVTPCVVFVAAAFAAVGLAAQAKPNLSGVWVNLDPQKPLKELSVKQDGSTLTWDGEGTSKTTINLDGSETKMVAPDGKDLPVKAGWEGNTLVVNVYAADNASQSIRRLTWTLDSDGRLVIETALTLYNGKVEATKEIFKRR